MDRKTRRALLIAAHLLLPAPIVAAEERPLLHGQYLICDTREQVMEFIKRPLSTHDEINDALAAVANLDGMSVCAILPIIFTIDETYESVLVADHIYKVSRINVYSMEFEDLVEFHSLIPIVQYTILPTGDVPA